MQFSSSKIGSFRTLRVPAFTCGTIDTLDCLLGEVFIAVGSSASAGPVLYLPLPTSLNLTPRCGERLGATPF